MGTAGSVEPAGDGAPRQQPQPSQGPKPKLVKVTPPPTPASKRGSGSSPTPKIGASPSTAEERQRRKELGLDDEDEGPPPASPSHSQSGTVAEGGNGKPKKKVKVVKRIIRKVISKSTGDTLGTSSTLVVSDSGSEAPRLPLFTGTKVEGWTKGKLIGKGATGSVFRAIETSTNTAFCVKEIEFSEDFADHPQDRARFEQLRAEIALLQDVDHPNVVRFIGLDKIGFSMYILMELVEGGTLSEIIKQFGALSDRKACQYTRQILEGLVYLHSKNIIHRDIKGANILVGMDDNIKLADFGAAKRILDPEVLFKTLAGTPYWMAPEVVRQEGHGKPADVWSLGATVLQMVTGLAPYQNLQPVAALFKIGHSQEVPLPPNANLATSPLVVDFISQCLQRDSAKRPTVEELLQHPWLQANAASTTTLNASSNSADGSNPANSDHKPTPGALARREELHGRTEVEEAEEIREFIRHVTFARALVDEDLAPVAGYDQGASGSEGVEVMESGEFEASGHDRSEDPMDEEQIEEFMANIQMDEEEDDD